ncbi:MAG: hypothetical protein ACWA6U_00510 [Breznakibacter sp.]
MDTIYKKILLPSFVAVLMLLPGLGGLAQNVSVKASLDSTVIVIGGQVGLHLEASFPAGGTIRFPLLNDTITSHVEVVSEGKVDSTLNNGLLTLHQRYTVTSFDSGLHYIPPFRFESVVNGTLSNHETASLAINVVNPFEKVDPAEGITDIKPPYNLPFSLAELLRYLPYIVGAMLLMGILTILILLYLRRKGKIVAIIPEKPKDPAYVVALRELERIKGEKLWQRNMVKEYYSEIADTIRKYIEERFGIPAMEFTTDQTLKALKKTGFSDQRNFDQLNHLLTTSDLVKFARFEPLPDEHDLLMIHALFFVNQTKVEEMKTLEEQKKEYQEKLAETN